jgi:hypothetical protein
MNITLHRTTLMVCMLAGALALTIALVAAKDVSAAPSPERPGGATQISGGAYFDDPAGGKCAPPPEGVVSDYPPLVMTGGLDGCLSTDILTQESSPSGTYRETGTEFFVSSDGTSTFATTYRFEAKYEDVANLAGEIFGRCQHPIVEGSGTGDFEGVSGILFFKDDVATGEYFYRGHLRY